jgi:hypothetical protein
VLAWCSLFFCCIFFFFFFVKCIIKHLHLTLCFCVILIHHRWKLQFCSF